MFSPEFMRFLINYQKEEYTPAPTKKVVYFNKTNKGKKVLAEVFAVIINR